ncbi:MAG: SDR family oxidoreductase [Bacteroidales bacterium]|jgi:NADP-dependent 3-hydroxy acid dehydrogenase YdfG|nr:SDR family oxidoreductase [Bacteroidales bacterium]MCK9499352.1 SDR family oxidoreductase [Bacteroidales bacterium]MDY0315326.1 SDR family oxidoreductase [Bacteroidales bacterium]NLB85521.1 SDR family oxidoreductase [Bacteroidales bacterium]
MKKNALISGATAGIGKATALLLSKNGYNLILTGRRKERLDKLKIEIESQSKVKVICLNFDIRSNNEVCKAIDSLPQDFKKIDLLVNNAGLAMGLSTIQSGDLEDWETMIDTNIKGLLYLTLKIAPLMIEQKTGHIINIGSIAGKEVYPNGNVYCATKHAVDALSKSMRIDMLPYGIKVTQIAPGMVDTEFSTVRFHGDKEKADKVYEGLTPLYAEDIAEIILFVANRPKHVNINDILVTPLAQATATNLVRNC